MSFDNDCFIKLLDALSEKIDSAAVFSEKFIEAEAAPLCDFLKISRLDEIITSDNTAEHRICYRNDGERNANGIVAVERSHNNSETILYCAYPYAENDPWDKAERSLIKSFINMLYIHLTRLRCLDETENRLYYDKELRVFTTEYFFKTISRLISAGQITKYSSVYFNIKRMSVINRYYGRQVGTAVLREFLRQLKIKMYASDIICRVGGDNFVALFHKENKQAVIDHLMGVEIDTKQNSSVMVSAYAGYYDIEEECKFAYEIMDRLAPALGMARNIAKLPYVNYDSNVKQRINEKRYIENIFDEALKNEEFLVYYQPKVIIKDYTLAGAEALCRWVHQGSMIYPDRFIPVLEQNHNICVLDFYMLDHVCKHIRRWLDKGMNVVKVSVNFSRVHLGNASLMEQIIEVIDRNNVPHEYIEIELTETTTDVDYKELKRVVRGLRSKGVSTSVDDFGIGYSSLSLIRDLPWNVLKIDKSFLPDETDQNSDEQSQKRTMLKYVISMAQSLGLECIVEGVETVEQIALLKQLNCYCVQGYFFDKPMPVEEFEKLLVQKTVPVSEA